MKGKQCQVQCSRPDGVDVAKSLAQSLFTPTSLQYKWEFPSSEPLSATCLPSHILMIQCLLKNMPNEVKSYRFILIDINSCSSLRLSGREIYWETFLSCCTKRGNGDLFRSVYFTSLHLFCVFNVFVVNVKRRVAKPDDQQTVTLTYAVWYSG